MPSEGAEFILKLKKDQFTKGIKEVEREAKQLQRNINKSMTPDAKVVAKNTTSQIRQGMELAQRNLVPVMAFMGAALGDQLGKGLGSTIRNTFGGIISGAMVGLMTGGPIGALIGGVAGGGLQLLGSSIQYRRELEAIQDKHRLTRAEAKALHETNVSGNNGVIKAMERVKTLQTELMNGNEELRRSFAGMSLSADKNEFDQLIEIINQLKGLGEQGDVQGVRLFGSVEQYRVAQKEAEKLQKKMDDDIDSKSRRRANRQLSNSPTRSRFAESLYGDGGRFERARQQVMEEESKEKQVQRQSILNDSLLEFNAIIQTEENKRDQQAKEINEQYRLQKMSLDEQLTLLKEHYTIQSKLASAEETPMFDRMEAIREQIRLGPIISSLEQKREETIKSYNLRIQEITRDRMTSEQKLQDITKTIAKLKEDMVKMDKDSATYAETKLQYELAITEQKNIQNALDASKPAHTPFGVPNEFMPSLEGLAESGNPMANRALQAEQEAKTRFARGDIVGGKRALQAARGLVGGLGFVNEETAGRFGYNSLADVAADPGASNMFNKEMGLINSQLAQATDLENAGEYWSGRKHSAGAMLTGRGNAIRQQALMQRDLLYRRFGLKPAGTETLDEDAKRATITLTELATGRGIKTLSTLGQ